MQQDGPKRQGRFIKKNDKVLDHVVLQDFSLEEICESPIVTFDNSDRSIVHAKLHDKSLLDESVRTPASFDSPLIDPTASRSVIMPRDFTADWRASRTKSGGRRKGTDEDDDDEFSENSVFAKPPVANTEPTEELAAASNAPATQSASATVTPFKMEKVSAAKPQTDRLEQLRPAAPIFDPNEVVKAASSIANQNVPAVDLPSNHDAADLHEPEFIALQTTAKPHDVGQNQPTRAGLPQDQISAGAERLESIEADAATQYRNRKAIQEANEKVLTQLKEEAKAAGFNEGFRLGEEKGELRSRAALSELAHLLTEVLQDLTHVKHSVLENAERNFHELAQAIGEALLGREFSISPEAFVAVVRKAISETVESDAFKVRLNPETFEHIAKLNSPELAGRIVKDPAIPKDHFRIESHLSVVDQNARKMITALLEQADLSLFTSNNQSSKTNKVG